MADLTYNDILSESLNITQTPLTEDTEHSVVQVTTTIDGVPQMRRMAISTLTSGVNTAIAQAQTASETATQRAEQAQTEAQTAIDDLRDMITAYYTQADQNVKRRLAEIAQIAETGTLDLNVDSFQLFEDFCNVTGFVGTYDDFLWAIYNGGGSVIIQIDDAMSSTSTNPVQNKVIKGAVDGKQDLLDYVSYTEMLELVNLVD